MHRGDKFYRWKPCTACNDSRQCWMLTFIDCIMVVGPVIWCRVFAVIFTKVCHVFCHFLPWFSTVTNDDDDDVACSAKTVSRRRNIEQFTSRQQSPRPTAPMMMRCSLIYCSRDSIQPYHIYGLHLHIDWLKHRTQLSNRLNTSLSHIQFTPAYRLVKAQDTALQQTQYNPITYTVDTCI